MSKTKKSRNLRIAIATVVNYVAGQEHTCENLEFVEFALETLPTKVRFQESKKLVGSKLNQNAKIKITSQNLKIKSQMKFDLNHFEFLILNFKFTTEGSS